jgi:hypothetical protein
MYMLFEITYYCNLENPFCNPPASKTLKMHTESYSRIYINIYKSVPDGPAPMTPTRTGCISLGNWDLRNNNVCTSGRGGGGGGISPK